VAHGKLTFVMPASADQAFEAFFNHRRRLEWDTLLRVAYVESGGDHPSKGVVTVNEGRGWTSLFAMRTEFVSYDPPRSAAARLVEPTGPFAQWAASMHHKDLGPGSSEIRYAYSIKLRPAWLGALLDPIASALFAHETRRRFAAMARYLGAAR
jgi:hypothetical protein